MILVLSYVMSTSCIAAEFHTCCCVNLKETLVCPRKWLKGPLSCFIQGVVCANILCQDDLCNLVTFQFILGKETQLLLHGNTPEATGNSTKCWHHTFSSKLSFVYVFINYINRQLFLYRQLLFQAPLSCDSKS